MGKLGTWYWNTKGSSIRGEESEGPPVLERFGDLPASPPMPSSLTPTGFAAQFGQYTSVQVNVNGQGKNILGDAANEPTLAMDSGNRNHLLVGWRQFDSVASNFRQAGNAYSTDGGSSWHNNSAITTGVFRSDPVLSADSHGHFYYDTLLETFYTDLFETTGGVPWAYQGPAFGGDKEWMTVDSSSVSGNGNLYEYWSTAGNNYGGRQFSRSFNGGKTWMQPIDIPGSPIWGTLDVATNGDLYLCGIGNTAFQFSRSSSARDPLEIPSFEVNTPVDLGGAIVYGSSINPDGLMGQVWVAADKSNGRFAGYIYMLCSVGVDAQDPCDVHFARSTDGGLTWSRWQRINDDLPGKGASHWFGTLSVSPNGRIDACWYDNRANPSQPSSALFYSNSYDGGSTWSPSVQVSSPFNPNIGYPDQQKIGDYIGMVSDNYETNIAYAATFNNEEDIWFLRIPVSASVTAEPIAITTYHGTYLKGTLYDILYADGSDYDIESVDVASLGAVADASIDFALPTNQAGTIAVRVRATAAPAATGLIWLYNWTTRTYDYFQAFGFGSTGLTDETMNLGTVSPAYIDPSGKVRMLVRALLPSRFVRADGFAFHIDLIQLLLG